MGPIRTLPLYLSIRCSDPVDGSKIKGYQEWRWRNHSATEWGPKWVWMNELVCRYVRRHRVLAAFSDKLYRRIIDKYGKSQSFSMPMPHRAIGYLVYDPCLNHVTSTGMIGKSMYDPEHTHVINGASYRERKLEALMKKKTKPEGLLLEAWILKTELEGILQRSKYERVFRIERYKHQPRR